MVSSTNSAHTDQVPAGRAVVFTGPPTPHTQLETIQHPDSGSADSGLVLLAGDSSAMTPVNAHHTSDASIACTTPEAQPLTTPFSAAGAAGTEATLRPNSEPIYYPTSKLQGLFPSQVKQEDIVLSHHWKLHPLVHPYAAVTTSTSKRRPLRSPVNGISRHVSNSADTTPRRYSNGGTVMVLKRQALAALPPLFSDKLLQRKEMIKSRLQFMSECNAWPVF